MASSKKKKSPKKPVAKKKAAPKGKGQGRTKVKAKAKPAAKKKAAPKAKKSAAKKSAPKKAPTKKAPDGPTHGDAWGNASLAPKVAKTSPKTSSLEPSGTPTFALHDHEGGLISPVAEEEELAERIHGGEEAVKNEDADDDAGSPRLDDREDSDSEE